VAAEPRDTSAPAERSGDDSFDARCRWGREQRIVPAGQLDPSIGQFFHPVPG
jgi:hypothetical protein